MNTSAIVREHHAAQARRGCARLANTAECGSRPQKGLSDVVQTDITASTVELAQAAAEGDEHAWELLVDRYSGHVWSVVRAHRLTGTDATDVVATTWLQLLQHLNRIHNPEEIGAWLATTARKESLRALRRIDHERLIDLESDNQPVDEPGAQPVVTERGSTFLQAMDKLPERCQALLRVLLLDPPLSYKEISLMFDMPIASVGPTRARCLQCLRRKMERPEHSLAGAR
jgi:RNA polymerase sigma factor (sigma-70 family)